MSSGSTSRGPPAWRRTPPAAHFKSDNALVGEHSAAAEPVPGFQHQRTRTAKSSRTNSRPTTWIGSRILTYDSYWKQWSIEENFSSIQVPALMIAAWYDMFQGGSLRNYLGIRAHGGTEAARNKTQLVVTIGGHSGWRPQDWRQSTLAPDAPFDENAITLDWYDYLFKGKQNQFANGKPVKIFVMGENKWRDEASWPLERAKETRYLPALGRQGEQRRGRWYATTVAAHKGSATVTFTIRPTRCRPWAVRFAAMPMHLPPGRATKGSGEPARCAGLLHAAARCRI